jgi:hypothetical protein
MIKKVSKYIAATFTLLLLSGGACYEFPKTIQSTSLSASSLFPEYTIYEQYPGGKGCEFKVEIPVFSLNSVRNVILTPPANVTFQGKILALTKGSHNKFPCQRQIVEFVLTDDKGGKRTDKFNLQQAKLSATKITADRSQDLQIPVQDFVYRQGVDVQTSSLDLVSIVGNDEARDPRLQIRDFSKKYPVENPDKTQPLFDRDTQTLIIPAAILKSIKDKTTSIRLIATVTVFNKRPDDAVLTKLLTYQYHLPSIALELK